MTIPNIMTIFRILLTPVLAWKLLEHRLESALLIFFLAGATDGLDGLTARILKQRSKLGACLDPMADKLLLVTSFALLAFIGLLPWWLVVIVVCRDLLIVLGSIALWLRHVPFEIRPVVLSKITTALELLTVLMILGSDFVPLPPWAYMTLFALTAFFCAASGIQYVAIGISLAHSHGDRAVML